MHIIELLSGELTIASNLSEWYTCSISNTLPIHEEGGGFLAERRVVDDALDIVEYLEWRIEKEYRELTPEQITSPLLDHVGIVDINKAWEVLSHTIRDDIASACSTLGNMPAYSARREIQDKVFEKLGVNSPAFIRDVGARGHYDYSFQLLQNDFYPVKEGSFIGDIANTRLWRRTLGIPQLGWKDNYPLENGHTRGAHQLFASVNIARVQQQLYAASPERYAVRLRQDFAAKDFYDPSMTDEEIALLGVRLGVLMGMTHDIFTPAGGDMMKHVMKMDEEADAGMLMQAGDERVEELVAILEKYGMNKSHLGFVIDCIQGKSPSLVGGMIHSDAGDVLEQDRLAYTVQDLFSAGILGCALSRDLVERTSLADKESGLVAAWNKTVKILSDCNTWAVGPVRSGEFHATLSSLDVSEDYVLSNDLELVCNRPDKLVWLAALRAMMSAEFYQGAKLRGQEHEITLLLEKLKTTTNGGKILNTSNLKQIDNYQLHNQLQESGGREVVELLSDMEHIIYPRQYESELVDNDTDTTGEWFVLPISIKPGLDTKVMDDGKVISLGEYVATNKEFTNARMLLETLDTYSGKKRIIRRIK